jgi:ABC-type dipeptide/oligopeptide/nickel transport system permease subunit
MLAAGVAWGAYSLLGRGAVDPLAATAGNFLRALPMAMILLGLAAMFGTKLDQSGLVYAIISERSRQVSGTRCGTRPCPDCPRLGERLFS